MDTEREIDAPRQSENDRVAMILGMVKTVLAKACEEKSYSCVIHWGDLYWKYYENWLSVLDDWLGLVKFELCDPEYDWSDRIHRILRQSLMNTLTGDVIIWLYENGYEYYLDVETFDLHIVWY